ncbi:SsgA family sporulation/cell division regulator [Streptomyces sp. NPDC059786]|uniref:SsgA family sporulation/cell division regulator n=1 Tax=Streptomyces sp. NPDC059786 TaxID=3346946 RepID=UPI003669DCA8
MTPRPRRAPGAFGRRACEYRHSPGEHPVRPAARRPRGTAQGAAPVALRTEIVVGSPGRPPVRLPAEFRYDRSDPYAVCLAVGAPAAPSVDWVFARSLLTQGLSGPAGAGDVLVSPRRPDRPDVVRIVLRSGAGEAVVEADTAAVTAFLRRADALVPPGTEHHHLDLDRVVARLTAGGE